MSAEVHLLAVNAGSSSVRLSLFRARGVNPELVAGVRLASAQAEPRSALDEFLGEHGAVPGAVAHRVVHGGDTLASPVLLDDRVERTIERLSALAPVHNPLALEWLRAGRDAAGPGVPHIAVFDTAFFAGLPPAARHYALPAPLARKHGLRRYGFHGIAHQAMWRRWRELAPALDEGGRVVCFQLGSGCSVCALERGRPLETSMGFSPLEGLMMATRSGDIDAAAVLHLQRHAGMSVGQVERLLNRASGLHGVAGEADMQRLLARADAQAQLALAMYCHRARKYLGAYLAVLAGADAILFGGGVGENAPIVRSRILEGMEWAGIALDAEANRAAGAEARISAPDARTQAWVIPVDEASILAEEAMRWLERA
jgi:acetate kinase